MQVAQDPAAKNEANIEQIEKDLWRTGLPAFKCQPPRPPASPHLICICPHNTQSCIVPPLPTPQRRRDQGEEGQLMVSKLRRVLLAYRSARVLVCCLLRCACPLQHRCLHLHSAPHHSVYDPLVGYCQAMNFIAGY